jgi:hypothetical protein
VESYYEIKKAYSSSTDSIQKIEQKIFYIIYMHKVREDWSYEKCINMLEEALYSYYPLSDVSLTDARKMIQVRFRESVYEMLSDNEL